jgi:hypothetical protein
MTCDRYWREGILLVERGMQDPHREGCDDCARAHTARDELVECLPLIGEGYSGDPRWQANVWQRIDGVRASGGSRWRWLLEGALATACILLLWLGLGRNRVVEERVVEERPRAEIVAPQLAKRSSGVHVDDHVQISVGPTSEVWIYHGERLVLRCRPRELSRVCAPDAHGMVVDMVLSVIGEYEVLVIDSPLAPPSGDLHADDAALRRAGITPLLRMPISVH